MYKFLLSRNYTTGWYTLRREDAINGMKRYLSERKGVKDIQVDSCFPAQLEGDKGYTMHVTYDEDLDETFGFPESLDKVIFLDVDSSHLPYNVRIIARETGAGIVIATPSIKDDYYDEGKNFSPKLKGLLEHATTSEVQIVGITPSKTNIPFYRREATNDLEMSIMEYLIEHPSINKFIILTKENSEELSTYMFHGEDIPWSQEGQAKDMLTGKTLIKTPRKNRTYGPYKW